MVRYDPWDAQYLGYLVMDYSDEDCAAETARLCVIKDADNEDVQNLISRAFMKSAEIRNKLSDQKDPQPEFAEMANHQVKQLAQAMDK